MDWYTSFQEKRDNRILEQFKKRHPDEHWVKNTDSLRAYGQESKGFLDELTRGHLKRGLDNAVLDNYGNRKLLHDAQDTKYFKSEGMGRGIFNYTQDDMTKHLKSALAEKAKDEGTGNLGEFSIKSGTTHTLEQARAVAEKQGRKALLRDLGGHLVGASAKESLLNSLGLMTADQKRLYSRPGMGNWVMRNGIRSAGIFNVYTGLTSDDPLVDVGANIASAFGGQIGWRGGKALANVMFGSKVGHASRVFLGGTLGAVGLAVPMLAGEAIKDVTKQDSYIGKKAKHSYAQEYNVEDRSSQMALTMRQAGLQKLSSSHLNDRGMLLGNEAAILRGVSY